MTTGNPSSAPLAARMRLVGAAVLFSTGGVAIKAATLTGWQVASFRSGVAALTVLLLLPGARRRWSLPAVAVGVTYAATMVLYVLGNKLTTAANTIYLQSTAPLYLLLLSPLVLGEPIRRRDVAFMGALAVGMGLFFVGVEAPTATAPNPFAGNLVAAAAGLTWALTVIGLRGLGRTGSRAAAGEQAVFLGNLFACVGCLPLALPASGVGAFDWAIVGYLGVVQIGLAYVLLTLGIREVTAFEAALLLLVEPVLNPVWTWLVHGERPGPWSLAGATTILAATAAKSWLDFRRARRPLGSSPGVPLPPTS
jgi:drug/metabolite transporter, DME family